MLKPNTKLQIDLVRLLSLCIVLLWMIIVFMLSDLPSIKSSRESSNVIRKIIDLIPSTKLLPEQQKIQIIDNVQHITRKSAHFLLYSVGSLTFLNFAIQYNMSKKRVFALLMSILYSISDEIHQHFVPGRSPQITDVFIDFLGAIFTIAIMSLIFRRLFNEKKNLSNNEKNN